MNDSSGTNEKCTACEVVSDRRVFVERAALVAAALLLDLGVPRRALAAMRPGTLTADRRDASTVTYPIPSADGVQIDRGNEIILARWQGVVIAFNLACPHQQAPLRWNAEDSRFECPKHHSKYTPDGTYISGRATGAMDRMGITRQGNSVVVDLNVMYKETEQPDQWKGAQVQAG
ncbi:MAG TPA: Rieske (2Fe-2S) protein [Gemmatimonadales bacterium]|jgi:Rieske Fe-S protein